MCREPPRRCVGINGMFIYDYCSKISFELLVYAEVSTVLLFSK